jgi:hypothetical protein
MAGRRLMARLLFAAACAVALLLCAAVAAAPWLAGEGQGWRRVLALFAHDAALRRTSLASAAGLIATACVFFRPGPRPPRRPRRAFGGGA